MSEDGMEHVGESMSKAKEIIARMRERAEDPEFQAQAARLVRETEEQAQARAATERKLRLHQAGVPCALWDLLAAADERPAITAGRRFLASPASCVFLVLAGHRGRGKTFAASWLIDQRGGRFCDAQDLVFAGSFDPIWRELAEERGVVVLDELGAEHRNAAFAASLYALFNRRYSHQRRTVICTNLNAGDFRSRYCPDPADRLLERLQTAGMWTNLPGESMRRHWSEASADQEVEA